MSSWWPGWEEMGALATTGCESQELFCNLHTTGVSHLLRRRQLGHCSPKAQHHARGWELCTQVQVAHLLPRLCLLCGYLLHDLFTESSLRVAFVLKRQGYCFWHQQRRKQRRLRVKKWGQSTPNPWRKIPGASQRACPAEATQPSAQSFFLKQD